MTQQGSPRPAPAAVGTPVPTVSRLSIAQMLGVMRVEFHRARAQRQPLCCLMVAVDGMDSLLERGAWQLKQAAMRAAYEGLKAVARERQCFGMSLMSGDRIMAIFPSTAPSVLSEFGAALNEHARKHPIDWKNQPIEFTLSLGASHNLLAETSSSFEGLVEKAGRALQTVREAKGDKYVMWRESEAEIAGIRDDIAAQRASFQAQAALLEEEASEIGGLQQAALVDRIQAIFAKVPRTPEIESVEKEIVALAVEELFEGRRKAVEAQMAEHKRQTDNLERRIAKLTILLGVTEEQLKRVLSMKSIDEGVASIYRDVQGLAPDAAQAEQKREMMAVIFRENLLFQKKEEAAETQAA
jgi:GGDEF domain-containing protein